MLLKEKKYYKWVVVALLWVVALLNYLDRQMLSTMRPSMQVDIAALQSAANFGHLMAVFLWIYGLMSPVSGIIADRLNRKWLIAGSLFVWSAVTLLMGVATSFNQLYGLRAVMGISEALYIPAALSLIADYHSSKTRSLAIGIHMIGLYAGQAFGGFGATVAQAYSWQATFHAFGIAGIIYAVVLILFLREHRPSEPQGSLNKKAGPPVSKTFKILFSNLSFWILLLYFTVPSIPGWAVKNWLPTLFSSHLGMEMGTAGPLATVTIAVSSLVGVVAGGLLSDRWVQKNLKGRVYTSALGILLTIPALLLLGYGRTLLPLTGAAFCFGLGFGLFDANNMPILCQLVAPKYRATAYGLMNMTSVLLGAWITDVLGRSVDAGHLSRDFAMLSVIVLLALILQMVLLNPKTIDYKAETEPGL